MAFLKENISHIEAAERQLKEAIKLHFENRDSVAIHTLACAALQIAHDLMKFHGHSGHEIVITAKHSSYFDENYFKVFGPAVRGPRNFFKHADYALKEKVETIEFPIDSNDFMIWEAINLICFLINKDIGETPEYIVHNGWMQKKYPKVFSNCASEILDADITDLAYFRKCIDNFHRVSK